jgi:hypothetical protein
MPPGEFSTRELSRVPIVISTIAAALNLMDGGGIMRFWGLIE